MDKLIRYSEIFRSFQGEGKYTGRPCIWLRLWSCNFECKGFGQKDPSDPSTYELPYLDFDVSKVKTMEDLPVWDKGCDSSYSWSKKFVHLAHTKTAKEICDEFEKLLHSPYNPTSSFLPPNLENSFELVFTGGEPMMQQRAILSIVKELIERDNMPPRITIETNGTQPILKTLADAWYNDGVGQDLFWSCSPKLSASGEPWEKAIKPEVLEEYNDISTNGQLKYVVDGSIRCWNEVEKATYEYREYGIDWPVWIMPVGADEPAQKEIAAKVADEAVLRGYNVSARVHVYVYGNVIGR